MLLDITKWSFKTLRNNEAYPSDLKMQGSALHQRVKFKVKITKGMAFPCNVI